MSDFSIQTSFNHTSCDPEFGFSPSEFRPQIQPATKDTISSLANNQDVNVAAQEPKNSKGFFEKIAIAIGQFWGSLFKEKEQFEVPSKSDISIADKSQKTKEHFHREMNEMFKRVLELEEQFKELLKDNPGSKEALLMKLLSLAIRSQLGLKEQEGFILLERSEKARKEVLGLNKSQQKIAEELAELSKKSSLAGKLDIAFLAATAVVILNVMGVFNNQPSLKNFFEHVSALATFAKSGNILLEGQRKGSLEEKEKETFLIRAAKDLAQDGITLSYEQLNQVTDDIALMWRIQRELLEKEKQTSSEMMKNR